MKTKPQREYTTSFSECIHESLTKGWHYCHCIKQFKSTLCQKLLKIDYEA